MRSDVPLDLTGVARTPGEPLASLAPAAPEEPRQLMQLAVEVATAIAAAGGRSLVVGGAARDEALRRLGRPQPPKDIDLEVYGLPVDDLRTLLTTFGALNEVGESFGVLKLGQLDISVPRRDTKVDRGHRGFAIHADPWLSFREAARRRDFTLNAMALDPLTGDLLDAWGGLPDLRQGVLRACDAETFVEDPLRVLRAAQFASRFGFTIAPETTELCRSLDVRELSQDRVGEEWHKLLLRSPRPSIGLHTMRALGVLTQLHPTLNALVNTPQDPKHHPEGDVFTHTGLVLDAAADEVRDAPEETRLALLLAALCHDLGKPGTTVIESGRIRSPGHAAAGAQLAEELLLDLALPKGLVARVIPLVREHMHEGLSGPTSDAAVRRLSLRLTPASIQELVLLGWVDRRGRGTGVPDRSHGDRLLQQAEHLAVDTSTGAWPRSTRAWSDAGTAAGRAAPHALRGAARRRIRHNGGGHSLLPRP